MTRTSTSHLPRHQRGVSLIFALIALVALMFGALAVVRNVDTGVQLLGNLGFKQDATASADQVTRQAITWLNANASALTTDIPEKGYYASSKEFASDGVTRLGPLDLTGNQLPSTNTRQMINWNGDGCTSYVRASYSTCDIKPVVATDVNRNTASYVIFRMCNKHGDYTTDSTIKCAKPMTSSNSGASGRGELSYSDPVRYGTNSATYFRILVRVKGFRNTTSVTETIVHF